MLTFTSPNGLEVSVGRSALENDKLTFSAALNDLWFHVHGIPGAHVVLRNITKTSIADECIRFAAALALRYSKATVGHRVDACFIRDVTKPKKAKPGLVEIANSWCIDL